MKKLNIYLLTIAFLASCSNNESINTKIESDLSKENINGNVASVLTQSYIAIEQNGETITNERGARKGYYGDKLVKYNKAGLSIEEIKYDVKAGNKKFVNALDNFGRTIERKYFDAEDKLLFELNYMYDKSGNNTETKRISITSDIEKHWIKKYDSQNNLIEYAEKDTDSTFAYIIKYENDSLGNVLSRTKHIGNGDSLHKLTYVYDDSSRLVEEMEFYQPVFSYAIRINTFEYNAKGLCEKEIFNDRIKLDTTTWNFDYIYDAHDNWVQQLQYKNDTLQFMIKRDIQYYE